MTEQPSPEASPTASPESYTCDQCGERFERGIHIGRNMHVPGHARYASYCCKFCRNQGELKFAKEPRL